MALWKDLAQKLQAKAEEIKEEAAKRAAKKAAEVAVEQTKRVAISAVTEAGKSLKRAGATIGEALWGDGDDEEPSASVEPGKRPDNAEAEEPDSDGQEQLLLKKKRELEARRKELDVKERAIAEARLADAQREREVDDELAEMKRRLAAKKK